MRKLSELSNKKYWYIAAAIALILLIGLGVSHLVSRPKLGKFVYVETGRIIHSDVNCGNISKGSTPKDVSEIRKDLVEGLRYKYCPKCTNESFILQLTALDKDENAVSEDSTMVSYIQFISAKGNIVYIEKQKFEDNKRSYIYDNPGASILMEQSDHSRVEIPIERWETCLQKGLQTYVLQVKQGYVYVTAEDGFQTDIELKKFVENFNGYKNANKGAKVLKIDDKGDLREFLLQDLESVNINEFIY